MIRTTITNPRSNLANLAAAAIAAAIAFVPCAAFAGSGGGKTARNGSSDPAESRRMIGILDVRVDGVPDDVKADFERELAKQAGSEHYWLASRAQMRDRMRPSTKWTEGCLIGSCLSEVRTQTNAELVVLASLTGSGTSFGYVITLVRTDTGRVLSQKAERCDVCTASEAMHNAIFAVVGLINEAPDRLPDAAGDQGAAIDIAVGKISHDLTSLKRAKRRAGITLSVLGLLAAGAGVTLYLVNDKPDYALGMAAAGGGMLASGVVVLSF
ncbi:MAG: hypothetical protein AB7P03_17270 [Kofleriaceae bacterium]